VGRLPEEIRQILDLSRWAPSGDNTQPWRFEILDGRHVVVHGFDTRDHCVYDLDGHASQISLGALLQTMEIAASLHGMRMVFVRRRGPSDTRPTFDVEFTSDRSAAANSLGAFIERRSVQRRPLKTRPLTAGEKSTLEQAVGPEYRVQWIEGFGPKLRAAVLMFRNAKLRLTMPEAYEVHRSIIDWGQRYSEDRVPDQALGADAGTLKLMRFVLGSWGRVRFFNRFMAGTWAPRIQMDLIPGLACAAHVVIHATRPPETVDDWVAVGQATQRFWLTATQLGLWHQPEVTPLIFARYLRRGIAFTRETDVARGAQALQDALIDVVGSSSDRAVWMGRIGAGAAPRSRSTRLPLQRLLEPVAPDEAVRATNSSPSVSNR
jgi:sulfur-carrier protein adenylyltransferase/sulfurtransferase